LSMPEDLFCRQRDDEYLALLREEAEFWAEGDAISDFCCAKLAALSPFDRYTNEMLTGSETRRWWELVGERGPFDSACTLGGGSLVLERTLVERGWVQHFDVFDVSPKVIANTKKGLPEQCADAFDCHEADLNFCDLGDRRYDMVLALSCLHHIVNLEHAAFAINKTLKHGGKLFLYDYVGERGLEASAEKIELVNRVYSIIPRKYRTDKQLERIDRSLLPHGNTASPFEAVRSDEILGVLERYLVPEHVASFGSLYVCLWQRLNRKFHRRSDLVGWIIEIDRIVSKTGYVLPASAFGIYAKRP